MKVFVSWSGPGSHQVALAFRDWLPTVLPAARPWVSSEDIAKGALWTVALHQELEEAGFGVICVVPENVAEPWILFEAGAMSGPLETNRVAPLLVGVRIKDLPGPLSQFQCTVFDEADVRRLVHSMNGALDRPYDRAEVDERFAARWPEFQGRVAAPNPAPEPRVERGVIVEEVVTPPPAPPAPEPLAPPELAILKFLSRARIDATIVVIASLIRENETRARYHLERLVARKLVAPRHYMGRAATYHLTSRGTSFVVENNLDR